MFDNLKNLSQLMSQAGQIKERVEQFHSEMEQRRVEAESGAGAVQIVMNGKCEVLSLKLDPSMLKVLASDGDGDSADLEMIEELIAAAFNAGQQKVQAMIQDEMKEAAGGLNIPGLEGLMGG